jgi:hypothetical protein
LTAYKNGEAIHRSEIEKCKQAVEDKRIEKRREKKESRGRRRKKTGERGKKEETKKNHTRRRRRPEERERRGAPTVGVGTRVGHRENTGAGVLQIEVLVVELCTVNALATGSVTSSEITTLTHKV